MFWDKAALVCDIFVNLINRKTHQRLREIMSERIGPEDAVLERACGTGLLSAVIAPKCRALTATDFSEKMLKSASENLCHRRNGSGKGGQNRVLPIRSGNPLLIPCGKSGGT